MPILIIWKMKVVPKDFLQMKVTSILMNFFKTSEVAVFRGTDGLSFNFLRVSKDYKYNITPRTRI